MQRLKQTKDNQADQPHFPQIELFAREANTCNKLALAGRQPYTGVWRHATSDTAHSKKSIHAFTPSFTRSPLIHQLSHPFNHLLIHIIRSFILPSTHPSIHSFIHPTHTHFLRLSPHESFMSQERHSNPFILHPCPRPF